MPHTHDLMVPQAKYKGPNGEDKTKWLKCGVIFTDRDKMTGKVEILPTYVCDRDTGEPVPWVGWFQVFDRQTNSQPTHEPAAGRTPMYRSGNPIQEDFDDDKPF